MDRHEVISSGSLLKTERLLDFWSIFWHPDTLGSVERRPFTGYVASMWYVGNIVQSSHSQIGLVIWSDERVVNVGLQYWVLTANPLYFLARTFRVLCGTCDIPATSRSQGRDFLGRQEDLVIESKENDDFVIQWIFQKFLNV
jgi:hypothetical protein